MTIPKYIEPVASEEKYQRLAKLGQELGIPIPETFLEMEVVMPNGNVLTHFKQRSHSWVRNAYNLLLSTMASKNLDSGVGEYGAGYLSIKTTAAAVARAAVGGFVNEVLGAMETGGGNGGFLAAAADATIGIQVGSDDTAEAFDDYKLIVPITEGVGAQQLSHVAMLAPAKSYAALTQSIVWLRYFNNNTTLLSDVLVKEVGLITAGHLNGNIKYLVSRDKLGATVTIPATGQLKVTYTINLVYPS